MASKRMIRHHCCLPTSPCYRHLPLFRFDHSIEPLSKPPSTMSTEAEAAAVIDNVSLPQGKRKAEEMAPEGSETTPAKSSKTLLPKAKETRLEQNRKAARESRRRKRIMLEELQRSVIFFSRANGALKQQNDELTRLLMQAQLQVAQHNNSKDGATEETKVNGELSAQEKHAASEDQKKADIVATQAMFESQGFPAAAARAAAQAMNGSVDDEGKAISNTSLPNMQPGATMQAMANFQQAAAAAMQQAMGQMKGVPGLTQMAATPVGGNPQHAFTDAMTAIAMQQAAAAAAAGQKLATQNNIQLLPTMINQMSKETSTDATAVLEVDL